MSLLLYPHGRIDVATEDPPAQHVLPPELPPELTPDDLVPDELVERMMLRLEFEAIIAAGYRAAGDDPGDDPGDEPRPVPPPRRVGTVVGKGRPITPVAAPGGNQRPLRPHPGVAGAATARERGPPQVHTRAACSQRARRGGPSPAGPAPQDRGSAGLR